MPPEPLSRWSKGCAATCCARCRSMPWLPASREADLKSTRLDKFKSKTLLRHIVKLVQPPPDPVHLSVQAIPAIASTLVHDRSSQPSVSCIRRFLRSDERRV